MLILVPRNMAPSTPSLISRNLEQGCWRHLEEGDRRGEAVQRVDGRALLVHGLVFGVGTNQAVQVPALKLVRFLRGAQAACSGCVCEEAYAGPSALCIGCFIMSLFRRCSVNRSDWSTQENHIAWLLLIPEP